MSLDAVINFGKVTVSGTYDSHAFAVTVSDATRLPDPATAGQYNIVWYNDTDYPDPSDDPAVEIARVISVSGNVLTLAHSGSNRTAQEGTTASAKSTSGKTYKILLALTAKMITDIQAAITAAAATGPVTSVFGRTGVVTAQSADYNTSQVTEVTNLYWTTARFDTAFAAKTTANLAENTNLYYTDVRADARITLQKGAANGIATLGADSKIPSSQLPALAITDTFVVGSQAAMLALTAQTGDVAVRTDLSQTFILAVNDPTILANWQVLLTPVDSVLSVNGKTGAVTLTTSDVAEGTNLYYTQTRFDTAFAAKSTSGLAEGSNLYFTNARAIAALLTAYASGAGVISSSDSVLSAIQKLNGNIAAINRIVTPGFTSYNNGSVIPTGKIRGFYTAPFAGTITGWSIVADAGTATVRVWKIAAGTAKPTVSNNINTAGVALATGTAIRSTTVTDFTTTAVTAGDIFAYEVTAAATATELTFELEITKT